MNRKRFLATLGKLVGGVGALIGLGGAAVAGSGGSRMRRGYTQGTRHLPAVEPAPLGLTSIEPGDPITYAPGAEPGWSPDKLTVMNDGKRYDSGQTITFTPTEDDCYTIYVAD